MPWYAHAFLAAVTIAAIGYIQKRTLQREHSLEYAAVYSVVKFVLFLAVFGGSIRWHVTVAQFETLALDALLGAMAFYWVIKALRKLELSTVAPVLALEPAIVALLAFATLGERLRPLPLAGLALAMVGTYVLELDRSKPRSQRRLFDPLRRLMKSPGGAYALLGLAAYAVASVIDRHLLQEIPTNTYLVYILGFAAAYLLALFLSHGYEFSLFHRAKRALMPIIAFTAVLHLVSNYAQAQATALAAVGLVIAIKRAGVLLDVALAGRLLHEHRLLQKTLASIIIIGGVILITRG